MSPRPGPGLPCLAMPTEKRERQRAGRESRREAARVAQQRAARRRQIIAVASLLVVVVAIGLLISRGGSDDDGEESVAADATSTTEAGEEQGEGAAELPAGTPGDPSTCPPKDGTEERHNSFPEPPTDCLEDGVSYAAEVQTDAGSFTIALDAGRAPRTVNNFVFLARNRYYEGVPFHRVIPDFVVQGGDGERGDGAGGPGYTFADELPGQGEYEVGSVAMANSGPDTNGSQFFVVTGARGAALDPNYSLFGRVTDGLDVVKAIEADGSAEGTPEKRHRITTVKIVEKEGQQ